MLKFCQGELVRFTYAHQSGMEYFNYHEEINIIGRIQDIGHLMAIRRDNRQWSIIAFSDNIIKVDWINEKNASKLLTMTIAKLFDPATAYTIHSLIHRFQQPSDISDGKMSASSGKNFQILRLGFKSSYEVLVCCSVLGTENPDILILEFEGVEYPLTDMSIPNNRILQSGELVGRIRSCNSIESVTSTFLDSVMEVLKGYDRGMIYRFGVDSSGDVIYEKIRAGSSVNSSYLNLRFPAEDIPPQARDIFVKTGVRFIYNVNGTDSKIISNYLDPIDLTMASLRGVSDCHLQYLRNMGIISSLSIAIVVEEKLWGLYILHSYTAPTKPNVEERIMIEMVGSITAMRIHSSIREIHSGRKLELGKVMLSLQTMKSVHEFLQINFKDLAHILWIHALVLFYDQETAFSFGDTTIIPTKEGYQKLCSISKMNTLLALHNFSEGLNGDGAGVLFYHHQYVTLAFIRKSKVCDIRWAGNPDVPNHPVVVERLQPRSSFLLYVEQGKLESLAWTSVDIELAQFAVDRITQHLHTDLLSSFRLSLDQSNSDCLEAIKSAKEHYEFFAHMSHELRTPFHGVMSSLQILSSGGKRLAEAEQMEIVESALVCGKTMLRILDDILTIAKSRNSVDVAKNPFLISKVVVGTKRMMSPIAEHKSITFESRLGKLIVENKQLTEIEFNSLVFVGDEIRIGQIVNNLTNNAIKFTSTNGSVTTTSHILSSIDDIWSLWDAEAQRFDHKFVTNHSRDSKSESNSSPSDSNASFKACEVISESSRKRARDNENTFVNDQKRAKTSGEVWFVFEIEDTGCGVDSEDLASMFEAYRQLSSGVSKTYQGTGLGLHICKLHIDSMHGILAVASSVGKGTLFLCAIPMNLLSQELNFGSYYVFSSNPSRVTTPLANSPAHPSQLSEPRRFNESIFLIVS